MRLKSDLNVSLLTVLCTKSINLTRIKPTEKIIAQITDESLETLNASFDITDWDMFIESAGNIDELVDTVTALTI